jgi:hypothetical protein
VRGDGAAVLASEEDRGRKEVVHEHQRHTSSTATVLVRMERPCASLATCERRGSNIPRWHGCVSSPPAASSAELEQAPTRGSHNESIAGLNRTRTERNDLPPTMPHYGGEMTVGCGTPSPSLPGHDKVSIGVAWLANFLSYLLA